MGHQADPTSAWTWPEQGWQVPDARHEGHAIGGEGERDQGEHQVSAEEGACMGVAVGNCGLTEREIFLNTQMSVNFLVSLLKKAWQNVKCLYLKSSMGAPIRIY